MLSAYRVMWLLVMYDLPTLSKRERKTAQDFRNFLLDEGFEMTQFSSYMKYFLGRPELSAAMKRIENNLPEAGQVYILNFTDKQYSNSVKFNCKKKSRPKRNPNQLMLF